MRGTEAARTSSCGAGGCTLEVFGGRDGFATSVRGPEGCAGGVVAAVGCASEVHVFPEFASSRRRSGPGEGCGPL
jgi:hypothetical protein